MQGTQQGGEASGKRSFVGSIAGAFTLIARTFIALAVLAVVAVAAVVGMGVFAVHEGVSTFTQIAEIGGRKEGATESKIADQAPAQKIAAVLLVSNYEANEVAADQNYKGKTLLVTGTVDDIGRDIMKTLYLTLTGVGPLANVQCYFAQSHESQLAGLSKGMNVLVKGQCDGKMMNVHLRGCTLEKERPAPPVARRPPSPELRASPARAEHK